ncbi:unnamed protein product [Hyaloperonospora brassicae]|uniref:Transmembrane protein n=1 Tax=Hyaloperonospora brassicae TaxID=162125 RepID=A0AAV0TMJ5_HYABA|nr:unnamed protein product [Hyaloperonospora brassicae]
MTLRSLVQRRVLAAAAVRDAPCRLVSAAAVKRSVSTPSSLSFSSVSQSSRVAARVGRDTPLHVVPRAERRAARQAAAKHSTDGLEHKVVRTSSLAARVSFALLAGSISGSILWHFVLDERLKTRIRETLRATFLGDVYVFVSKKVEETVKPFTDPSREKLLPDWPIPQVPADTLPVPVLVVDLEDTLVVVVVVVQMVYLHGVNYAP